MSTLAGHDSPRYPDWHAVDTMVFDWGYIKWIVTAENACPDLPTLGMVVMLPSKGHARHNHPESHELLYVVAGEGEQMVEDTDGTPIVRAVRAGDVVHIPQGVFHSTVNTGWEPMRVLAMYAPSGAEHALRELPDFRSIPSGTLPPLTTSGPSTTGASRG